MALRLHIDFNPITDLPTGVQFSFYGNAFVLGTEDFPLALQPGSWPRAPSRRELIRQTDR